MSLRAEQILALEALERAGASLSMVGSFAIFITYWKYKRLRTVPNTFILFASVANVGASVACLIGYDGIRAGESSFLCQLQAFLLEMFMQSDSWWSLAMAVNVFMVFFLAANPNAFRRYLWVYSIICFGGPGIPALVCLLIRDPKKGLVYGDATMWCWIKSEWSPLRIYTYYLLIWICIVASAVIYIAVGYHVFHQRNQLKNLTLSHVREGMSTSDGRESASGEKTPLPSQPVVYGTVTTDIRVTSTLMPPHSKPLMCPSTRSHMPSNTRSGPDWPLPPTEGIGANDDANFDTDLESGRSGRGSDNSQSASLGGPLKSEAIAGSQHLGVPATAVPIGFPHHGQHYRQVSRIESTKHGASIPAGSASTLPCRRFPFSWYRGRLSSTSSSITTCTEKCPAYGHGQDSHDHSHRRPSLPRRLAYRLASHLTHMDPVKLAYLRTSFIFAVSVLVTWTPSSINRVWALVHPPPATAMPTPASNSSTAAPGSVATDDRVPASTATIASALLARSTADDAAAWLSTTFALSVASSAVLPLQGLWNAVIYFTTSWATVNDEWRRKRERSLPMRGQLDGRQHNRHHPHHCHGGFSGNHHSRRTRSRRATGDNLTEPPLAVGSWSSRLRHSSSTTGRESSGDTDTMETRDLPITVLRDERDPARWDRDHGPMPSVTLSVRPTSGGFRPTLGVSGSVLPPPGIMARDCCSRGSGEVTLANVRVARDGSF